MKLLTKAILDKLPKLGAQENVADPIVHLKLFTPSSHWTWYATEGQQQDGDFIFFGMVHGDEKEWGYFSLNELESVKGPFGLGIERDRWFEPQPYSAIQKT